METCILWKKRLSKNGYGIVLVRGRDKRAHRVIWEWVNGKIPDGMILRHSCDVRHCVRLSHLQLGTHQDNMNDMVMRNRQRKGEAINTVKLTAATVAEIRQLHKQGVKGLALAKMYSMHHSTISDIVNYRSWKWLKQSEGF